MPISGERSAPDRRNIEVVAGLYRDVLENFGIDPEEFEPRSGRTSFVSDDLRAQLVTSALTSISFIQIDVFDEPPPVAEYTFPTPWETIPTTQSTFKSLERGLMDALDRLPHVAEKAEALLVSLDQGVQDLQVATLSREVVETLEVARALMTDLKASPFVDRDSTTIAELDRTLTGIADLAEGLKGPSGQVERVVARFDAVGAAIQADFEGSDIPGAVQAMESAGTNLSGTSQELSTLLREMRGGLDQVQAVLTSLQGLTDMISKDPGSLLHGRSARALPFRR